MKKIIVLVITIANIGLLQAQYTAIPDTCFEQHLIDLGIDSEGTLDGQVLTADIDSITSLTMHGGDNGVDYGCYIHSLEGIDAFVALEALDIRYNGVQYIDVSNLPHLKELNCFNNFARTLALPPSIEVVNAGGNRFIQNIDLSQTTHLKEFYVYGAWNDSQYDIRIDAVDLSNCPLLTNFTLCDNNLTSIDISNNPLLKKLNISWNHIDNDNFIHNDNALLEELRLAGNIRLSGNNFTSIDVSNLEGLKLIVFDGNDIQTIDLSHNVHLERVQGKNCPMLTSIDLRNGQNSLITHLRTDNTPNLTCIYVDDAQYSETNWQDYPYFRFDDSNTFVETEAACDALSVDESVLDSFAIYPNPVKNILYIAHPNDATVKEIVVYTILGKEIVRTTSNSIDLSAYTNGVYVVKIKTTANKTITKKIIKTGV